MIGSREVDGGNLYSVEALDPRRLTVFTVGILKPIPFSEKATVHHVTPSSLSGDFTEEEMGRLALEAFNNILDSGGI